jgi:hypothetical protein
MDSDSLKECRKTLKKSMIAINRMTLLIKGELPEEEAACMRASIKAQDFPRFEAGDLE